MEGAKALDLARLSFYGSVILFDNIVKIFVLPDLNHPTVPRPFQHCILPLQSNQIATGPFAIVALSVDLQMMKCRCRAHNDINCPGR